jgi:glycosyltransferase involved in cell wall biosynthesis
MKKLLFGGQIPPPIGGQAIHIERILNVLLQEEAFKTKFHRMNFAKTLSDIGSFSFQKIILLAQFILGIIGNRFKGYSYFYYPPSGNQMSSFVRDVLVLITARIMGYKLILHSHAGGLDEMYEERGSFFKRLMHLTYNGVNSWIFMSKDCQQKYQIFKYKESAILPYGSPSPGVEITDKELQPNTPVKILFIGVMRESKGFITYCDTLERLKEQGHDISGIACGKIFSEKEETRLNSLIDSGLIDFRGIVSGQDKEQAFLDSDIMLFPTFFESENFPTVILEAFSYSLPVISTNWRSVPEIITNGEDGFTVEPRDIDAVVESYEKIIEAYSAFSNNAKKTYLKHYTIEEFNQNVKTIFNEWIK